MKTFKAFLQVIVTLGLAYGTFLLVLMALNFVGVV